MGHKKPKLTDLIPQALPKLSKHEVDAAGDRVWKRIEAEMEKRKDDLAWRSLYGDGWTVPALSEGDLQILTAVQLLGEKATGSRILRTIEKWTQQPPIVTISLDRLEKDGLLTSSGSGDHWKRFYTATESGEGALHRARVEGRQVVAALSWSLEEEEAMEGGLAEQAE
jgi:DNA-binding PadR family transcriptional regulator